MSYTALYRKFRPVDFDEVKGQDHITDTLKNQVKAGRIGHAYLFCGTRGTGKTSVAKILAKAVNCEHPVDGNPCGECPVCQGIQLQRLMNVIEIDAASNNGVDNIREIRDEVAYSPTEGRYKVYIIDEVHMLSTGAFNALLKTLEEPPAYVIFILATTESHKIPITIMSRCQKYEFHRISIDTIARRLMELMKIENQDAEEKALRYIAKAADGSMRDALSLLDQCISYYLGKKLTYENVLLVLGAVDTEVYGELLGYISSQDIKSLIKLLDGLIMQGRELTQFVVDFTWYLRNLLLLRSSDGMEEVIDYSPEQLEKQKEIATRFESGTLMRFIRIFSELSNQMKYSSQKRILAEIALIKLCKPQMEKDYHSILDRLSAVEKKLEQGSFMTSPVQNDSAPPTMQAEKKPVLQKAVPEDVKKVVSQWKTIKGRAFGLMKTYLRSAGLTLAGDSRLELVFEDAMAGEYFRREEHRQELEKLIADQIGKQVDIIISVNETGKSFEDAFVDLSKVINMDISIE